MKGATLLALILAATDGTGNGVQSILGIAGAGITAVGGVAWVMRVENDLVRKYRRRVQELEIELAKTEAERDEWRWRFFSLAQRAVKAGLQIRETDWQDPN